MSNVTLNGFKSFLCGIGLLVLALSAQGASFDCGKAQTKVEHLICDNPEISKLDDELGAAYKVALKNEKRADFIREAQKQWVKDRNACADAECVKQAYENRVVVLAAFDDKEPLLPLKPPAAKIKFGLYKMINDTFVVPQPNGISIVEKHAEICTAFLKNLEAFPPFPPMACDVKFKPEFTAFKTPEWQEVDVWANRDLYMQTFQTPPGNDTERARGLVGLRAYIDAGMIAFRIAQFDIDNDGVTEQILEVSNGKRCNPASKKMKDSSQRGYRTYNLEKRIVDIEKDKFYSVYWSDHSLFSYKGITYYAELMGGVTNEPYFGKLDRPDKNGIYPTKYYIRLHRPIPMNQGIKQPVALGCEYLYLPANNEGGY